MLKDEFEYYKAHQDEIVSGHLEELVVIKDCKVKGTDIARFHNSMITFADAE